MTKRILALTLCIVMLCTTLFGCAKKENTDPGAYITMYLTDEIYDFDPASAYYNTDAVNVLSLMYETLFKLDENGKIKKSLVDSYEIVEKPESNEYYIEFTLKEAYWSVKDQLTAEHIVFAWKRLVDFRNDYDAASLLFDVKNARAIKEGDIPVDDLGVEAVEDLVVKVSFDAPIDYDQFLLNLTCVATAPLLERYVSSNPDWAKKASTIATSGPFKLGKINYAETGETVFDDNKTLPNGTVASSSNNKVKKISHFYLERNIYYFRDTKRDDLDKSVKPYRLLVDCSKTPEQLLEDFQNDKLFYIGNIPLSLRTGENAEYIQKKAQITDALSTFVVQLNQNALIADGSTGSYLFANPAVRQALSLAIDREAIADAVVFAEAADAFVANGVFDHGTSGEFRTSDLAASLIKTSADVDAAKKLLADNGVNASLYTFSLKVAANDEVHVAMAEMICTAWAALGFNVTVEKAAPIQNNDYFDQTGSVPPDVCDDLFVEAIQNGKFEAIALDANAFTADAYSMLSNYAYAFSGTIFSDPESNVYDYDTHVTGYDSIRYNILMEAIYYIPYFASLDTLNSDYLISHLETKPYEESAISTLRKLATATTNAQNAFATAGSSINTAQANYNDVKGTILKAKDKDLETAMSTVATTISTISVTANSILEQFVALETVGKQTVKDVVAAQINASMTEWVQEEARDMVYSIPSVSALTATVAEHVKAAQEAQKALKPLLEDKKATDEQKAAAMNLLNEAIETAFEDINLLMNSTEITLEKADEAVVAMNSAKNSAKKQTLKEAIQEIYDANEIVPSTKKADWRKQKSVLLHKAEEQLMKDLPVIPVVYNQNAILIHSDLSNVDATFYTPAYFRKTKLKGYKKYTYYNAENKKTESIFKNFPEIMWDKVEN